MKARVYFFRVFIGLSALVLGLGIYWIVDYFQTPVEVEPNCIVQSEIADVAKFSPVEFKPEPEVIEESLPVETVNEFHPDGEFYSVEALSKEFKDLDYLSISANDWTNASDKNNWQPTPILPNGYVQTNKKYLFEKISINNRLIYFETETIKGISYEFVGNYPDYATHSEGTYYELEGILTKYKNGKKIAKIKLSLETAGC